ncbi:hypothetical protein [Bradyrhizobium liaoningense]|uniref:hypothetical protein n=1 Tax=Bradyrhizobium liaoningense TaxID=43992 RepID=UPI001BA5DC52|nr:hypothetical protein [Bradyrhizobium liaoningense]MBR1170508.1 hypothetical protein [Bradyrhizobium liaoningense]
MCVYFPDLMLACGCPDCRACVDRELPLPLPDARVGTVGSLQSARASRWRELLAVQCRIAVAMDAPLSRTPVLVAERRG